MRNRSSSLIFLLIAVPCFGQHASVNVNADAALPHDTRPFGKYLVEDLYAVRPEPDVNLDLR